MVTICLAILLGCGKVETAIKSTEPQENTKSAYTSTPDEEMIKKLFTDFEDDYNLIESDESIENKILYKFLFRPTELGHYLVVSPETSVGSYLSHNENFDNMESNKDYIIDWFNENGYDVSSLFDNFLKLNRNPSILTIKSSLAGSYYINHDAKFEEYLEELNKKYELEFEWREFWSFMDKYYPHFMGNFEVSLPAYDPDTGYVLIYSGYVGGGLFGSGGMNLLKYEDGELIEICYDELWVS